MEIVDRSIDMRPFGGVIFSEKDHTYRNKDGEIYGSPSRALEGLKNSFDSEGISKYKAIKNTLTPENFKKIKDHAGHWSKVSEHWEMILNHPKFNPVELKREKDRIQKEWKDKAEAGTVEHDKRESQIKKSGFLFKGDIYNYDPDFNITNVPNVGRWVIPEAILWSHEFKTGGLADVLLFDNGVINIVDFKTNKAIEKSGFMGRNMSNFLSHLPDCNFISYSIQLEMYLLMALMLRPDFIRGVQYLISTASGEYKRPVDIWIETKEVIQEVEKLFRYRVQLNRSKRGIL